MATVKLKSNEVNTIGSLPAVGSLAPDFSLTDTTLSTVGLSAYKGKRIVLNIFPSLDTDVCAMSVRAFNKLVGSLDNTVVLAVSKDLPFAFKRFCTVENIANVAGLSGFRDEAFGKNYGVCLVDSPLKGLYARAVVVVNEEGNVAYTELVDEITHEPDYQKVVNALK